MSSKGPKEKSSSQKFWKKFGLGKSSKPSHPTPGPSIAPEPTHDDHYDDDRSIKSKRLSGLLPTKRQSMSSLKRRQSSSYPAILDTHPMPVPLFSPTELGISNQGSPSHGDLPKLQEVSPKHVGRLSGTPATFQLELPNSLVAEPSPGIPKMPEPIQTTAVMPTTPGPTISPIDQEPPKPIEKPEEKPSIIPEPTVARLREKVRPRYNSNPTRPGIPVPTSINTTSRLATLGNSTTTNTIKKSSSKPEDEQRPKILPTTSNDRVPRPAANKSSQSQSQPSASTSGATSVATNSPSPTPTSNNSIPTSPVPTPQVQPVSSVGTKLRKPTQITVPLAKITPPLRSSRASTPAKSLDGGSARNSKVPADSEDKVPRESDALQPQTMPGEEELTIAQLQEDLKKERSVVRVLQGQKEAISKDLDYFSMTVDELMEEKEMLLQQYEEEKAKNQAKEDDLAMLLEKLKVVTDNARDKAYEAEQSRQDLEYYQRLADEEKAELYNALSLKDQAYDRLKSEYSHAQEQISALKSTMEQLIKAQAARPDVMSGDATRPSGPWIYTPSASPHIQHAHVEYPADLYESHSSSLGKDGLSAGFFIPHKKTASQDIHPTSSSDSVKSHSGVYSTTHSSSTTETQDVETVEPRRPLLDNNLDDQLMVLTKEKEKLQSDYSKIPLTGGGPMSRRRKEELEEMLDEVDSQLSKVKQKIRRS
ncbi:hypothetical protein CLU79DRAFT_762197 [Phycomyces nitens]|nr:hypothetical protein CLU79DRAFT_762197 [Phycomyces nitens]